MKARLLQIKTLLNLTDRNLKTAGIMFCCFQLQSSVRSTAVDILNIDRKAYKGSPSLHMYVKYCRGTVRTYVYVCMYVIWETEI